MKIATYNCNSIRSRLGIISEWILENKVDVMCLQETKVQDKDFPELEFSKIGYHVSYVGQKAYNGVAIISKDKVEVIKRGLDKDPNKEARFMEVKYLDSHIINVYVPQGTSVESERFQYKLTFLDLLFDYISETFSPDMKIVITGDFNVALTDLDVYDPEGFRNKVCFHPEEQRRFLRLLEWGFVDLFRYRYPKDKGYTFWDYRIPNGFKRNLGWRIDYILSTKIVASTLVEIMVDKRPRAIPRPSDHTVLWAEFGPS